MKKRAACCNLCDIEPPSGTKLCTRCKAAQYCSKQCQISDWRYHKLICHPLLCVRLKKVCELEGKFYKYGCSTLDGRMAHIVNETSLYWLQPFKRIDYGDYHYCVLCGKGTPFDRPCFKQDFSFTFKEQRIDCIRCDDCLAKKKHICSETFMEANVCVHQKRYQSS